MFIDHFLVFPFSPNRKDWTKLYYLRHKNPITRVHTYLTSKRIELESPYWSDFETHEIFFQWGEIVKTKIKSASFFLSNLMRVLLMTLMKKSNLLKKQLIVAPPDQFSWIPHALAHQNCYCTDYEKKRLLGWLFQIRDPFFWAQVVFQLLKSCKKLRNTTDYFYLALFLEPIFHVTLP